MSAAPETGDNPATIATGARNAITIATMTAYLRPPKSTAAFPTIAGIEAQVAAPCNSPVPIQTTNSMTMAGSRVSTTTANTSVKRRFMGNFVCGATVFDSCLGMNAA